MKFLDWVIIVGEIFTFWAIIMIFCRIIVFQPECFSMLDSLHTVVPVFIVNIARGARYIRKRTIYGR